MTGAAKLISQAELDAEAMQTADIVNMCLVYPFTLNFTEPMVFFLNLYTALIYGKIRTSRCRHLAWLTAWLFPGLLYIWFESFPLVFGGIYGFSSGSLGLSFLGLFVGMIIVAPPFFIWINKYLEAQFDENGEASISSTAAGMDALSLTVTLRRSLRRNGSYHASSAPSLFPCSPECVHPGRTFPTD